MIDYNWSSDRNSIMFASRLPDQLRPGLITPILKKGKDGRNPDSYRRITVSPILGKFLEKEMLRRTRQSIKHEPLQFGFTEGCSSTTCAFIITEAVAEAMDLGHPLYISFLDAKKAFDLVSHTNMLGSLFNEGLEAPLWRMYADIYSHITSKVKLQGNLSREIKEGQGIRQGADTSPEIFNGRGNSLIRKLKTLTDSARIGSIPVGAPTTADDIAMLSKTRLGAQTQLLIAEDDANKKRYLFSTTKSRIMAVNSTASDKESLHLTLNGEEIKMSEKEKHVGLQRTERWGNKETVEERIKSGRRTAYALFGSGYHGLNGLPPIISTRMVSLFVTPVMLHSLEALILKNGELELLEIQFRKMLRCLQHLPESTALPAVYLLLGCLPIQAQYEQRKLGFFNRCLLRENSVEQEVMKRQLSMKDLDSHSWTVDLRLLLHKYELPGAFSLTMATPGKELWKRMVKDKVTEHWESKLREQMRNRKTLEYMNPEVCAVGVVHPVWRFCRTSADIYMASVKVRLMVKRYPLSGETYSGARRRERCTLCGEAPETTEHFLLECPFLTHSRRAYMARIEACLSGHGYGMVLDERDITKMILDPSFFVNGDEVLEEMEKITRRMCYAMHRRRCLHVEGSCREILRNC